MPRKSGSAKRRRPSPKRCVPHSDPKKKYRLPSRKSPAVSANTKLCRGTTKLGRDGCMYKSKKNNKNDVFTWRKVNPACQGIVPEEE